jgi:hypothetical protein
MVRLIQAYNWGPMGMRAAEREHFGVAQFVRADDVDREIDKIKGAVEKLYFAAYWSPDRPCDAVALWTAVRDAVGIEPGQTAARLGEPRDERKAFEAWFIEETKADDLDAKHLLRRHKDDGRYLEPAAYWAYKGWRRCT